jgi:hypothetical protein
MRDKLIVSEQIRTLHGLFPQYARLFTNLLEDMEDMDEMTTGTPLSRIFRAIDEGCHLETEIQRRTGIEKLELHLLLEQMIEGVVLYKEPQGGKTDGARGARKWLYFRVTTSAAGN